MHNTSFTLTSLEHKIENRLRRLALSVTLATKLSVMCSGGSVRTSASLVLPMLQAVSVSGEHPHGSSMTDQKQHCSPRLVTACVKTAPAVACYPALMPLSQKGFNHRASMYNIQVASQSGQFLRIIRQSCLLPCRRQLSQSLLQHQKAVQTIHKSMCSEVILLQRSGLLGFGTVRDSDECT